MKLSEIHINPNNPRLIKDERFKKLCKSIMEFPKMMSLRPIIVDSDNMILGGNMRFKALKELGYKEVPDDWIKRDSELTDEEKQRFIIADNIGFGEYDWDELANSWDQEDLESWGLEIPDFKIKDEIYSKEIKSPVYEPVNEKPPIKDLCDETKSEELIKEIMESDISNEDKRFLILAAKRHLVFNYSKIADFYANSDKEVQELMEKSALVIIDFNKAIENGFVKLSEEIADLYSKDYGDEE